MQMSRGRILVDGLVVSLIGYAVIAGYFALANAVAGRSPFWTAELLGRGLLGDSGATLPAFAPVLAYNAIHLLVFLGIGIGVASLVQLTERHPRRWFPLLLLGAAGLSAVTLGFFLLVVPGTKDLPWLSVVGANLAAAVAMATYLVVAHPRLWSEVEKQAEAGAI